MEVGHLVDNKKDLEIRWWSSSGHAYLDTIEVYRGDSTKPSWVQHFDPRAEPAAVDVTALARTYNATILPESIAADRKIIAELKPVASDALAAMYESAADGAGSLERERYCLDVARMLYFLSLRDRLMQEEAANPYASRPVDRDHFRDPKPESAAGTSAGAYTMGDSEQFWSMAHGLHRLDQTFADGDFASFSAALSQLHLEKEPDAPSR